MKEYKNQFICVFIALFVNMFLIWTYGTHYLDGNFNKFFLPAEMFGVPQELKQHGVSTFYKAKNECGWDGQFYYYIANDIFAIQDTEKHIDSNSYRYQRIGVPLFSKIISKVFMQTWVSPLIYYLSQLSIFLLATFFGAGFFLKKGMSPYLILFWALGVGSHLTILNGLPDVGADSFLILSIIAINAQKKILSSILLTFAALSREVYILVPTLLFISYIFLYLREDANAKDNLKWLFSLMIPIAVFCAWQMFIRYRFGVAPNEQAIGILGLPFVSFFHFLIGGMTGHHDLLGNSVDASREVIGLILYFILMISSFTYLIRLVFLHLQKFSFIKRQDIIEILSFSIVFFLIGAIYFCFGSTVMMHYTGYMKAANIFLFVLPWCFIYQKSRFNIILILCLLCINFYFSYILYLRVSVPAYKFYGDINYLKEEPNCVSSPLSKLEIKSIKLMSKHPNYLNYFKKSYYYKLDVKITNLSNESYFPYLGKGAVNLSYQWLNSKKNKVLFDGIRTPIFKELKSHDSMTVHMEIPRPNIDGKCILVISLVQEGCHWFYLYNSKNGIFMPINMNDVKGL